MRIAARLVEAHPAIPEYRRLLGCTYGTLGEALEAQKRLADAERANRQAIECQLVALKTAVHDPTITELLISHYAGLARVLRSQGRVREAIAALRRRRDLAARDPFELYRVAADLALCVPLSRDSISRQEVAREAVECLQAAITAGWKDAPQATRDPALAPLHNRNDFQRLIADLFDRHFPGDPWAQ
jgi:tetratricopeptide (TPR) repeat protein